MHSQPEDAQTAILHVLRRDPHPFGIDRARWRQADLLSVCDGLPGTPGGLSRLLGRLGIRYLRGRDHLHSPDPDYVAKRAFVGSVVEKARASGGRIVALYQDELTYYRQPTIGYGYEERGRQPYAERALRTNTPTRATALLNVLDGRVDAWQRGKIGIAQRVKFSHELCWSYLGAARIDLIQDHWPVHGHPDVLVALEEPESPWPRDLPRPWPQEPREAAPRRWGELRLPIPWVPLPTDASWTNPIEQLGRWLRQEVLHLHRLADDLTALCEEVRQFRSRFGDGSEELLRYVGLLVPVSFV